MLRRAARHQEQPRPASRLIRDIIAFSDEAELDHHEKYLVDSLEHCCPELMDWEAMVDLLAEEQGAGEEALQLRDHDQLGRRRCS